MTEHKTYIWDWNGGGYNTCNAASLSEAISIAKKIGEPNDVKTVHLHPINVRLASTGEVSKYDRMYWTD